jgi:hypothetical protein
VAITWNPADKSASITLSNGNLTATQAGGGISRSVRANAGHTTGKYVASATADVVVGVGLYIIGLANSSQALDNSAIGNTANGFAWYDDGTVYYNNSNTGFAVPTFNDADTITLAWDLTARRFWCRVNGGNWNNNASADPATNTGGHAINAGLTGTLFLAFGSDSGTDKITLKTTASVPSGFTDLVAAGALANLRVKDAGTWKTVIAPSVKDAGTWKLASGVWIKDAGTWKKVFG